VIAGIADIERQKRTAETRRRGGAEENRDRKGKTLPLIDTDDTDRKAEIGAQRDPLKSTPNWE
jgi:hypothetical protein